MGKPIICFFLLISILLSGAEWISAGETAPLRSIAAEKNPVIFSNSYPIPRIVTPEADTEIPVGGSVYFSGNVLEGWPPFAYYWDFGGGAPESIEKDPGEVVFDTKGVYIVTFSVKDDLTNSGSAVVTIYVGVSMDDDDDDGGGGGGGCFIKGVTQ